MTGAELQAWLTRHGYSLSSGAIALGLSRASLIALRQGRRMIPPTITILCAALDEEAGFHTTTHAEPGQVRSEPDRANAGAMWAAVEIAQWSQIAGSVPLDAQTVEKIMQLRDSTTGERVVAVRQWRRDFRRQQRARRGQPRTSVTDGGR